MMSSQNEPRIYNSILINNYLKLFRSKYPHIDINDLLNHSGIAPHEIEDPMHWLTQTQADRFFDRFSALFDDPLKIAREAGRNVYVELSLGAIKYLSINILGVGYIYKHAAKIAGKLTKTTLFSSRRLSSNQYEINVTLLPGFKERPHQEQNRIGIIEAAPLLYSDKLAGVETSKSGRTTTYKIKWDRPRSVIITRLIAGFLAIFLASASFIALSKNVSSVIVLAFVFIVLSSSLFFIRQHLRYKELSDVHKINTEIVNQTIDKFYSDYEALTVLNEVADIINKNNELKILLQEISKVISTNYPKGAFFISDNYKEYVSVQHAFGYNPDLADIKIDLNQLKNTIEIKKPSVFETIKPLNDVLPLKRYSHFFGPSDFPMIFIPITFDQALIGFILLSPQRDMLPVKQRDLHFLMGISSSISAGIHRLYAFASLVENDRIKSDFITTASHELRTPVQIILLGISNLEKSFELNSPAVKDIDIVKSGTYRLREIISNIMDLSTLGSSKDYNFNTHRVADVFLSLRPDMENLAAANQHKVFFNFDDNVKIKCDSKVLPTALLNLFSNSCKYTARGGKIYIDISENLHETRIDVIDNGYGIPKEIQDKVFIRFFQADTAKNETVGGCGIGLSIANEIIKAHGGEISITSPLRPGDYTDLELSAKRQGTRARIHLPK